jgi:hypothetical protein
MSHPHASPILQKAIAEIKDILLKYDIAGVVVVHTPGYSGFLNHITTSYSCAFEEPTGIRVKASIEQYGSKEKRDQMLGNTVNMLIGFREESKRILFQNTELINKLKEVMDIKENIQE